MSKDNTTAPKGEAFALRPVPKSEQKSWMGIVWVQSGMVICIPAFLLGSMLGEGMSTVNGIVAGVIGYIMVLILTFILGIQGADLHIPTCSIAQSTFGRAGTRLLVSSLFTISLMGFFGLQVNVCGEALTSLLKNSFNVDLPVQVSSLICGAIMVVVAVYGMELLKNVDAVTVPLLFIVMVVALFLAFKRYGAIGITENDVLEPTMNMFEGIALSFSFFSAAAFTAPDITRFQRSRRDTIISSTVGLMPAGIATLVIGMLLSRVAGIYDITLVLSIVGLPIIGMIVLIVSATTTNALNAYCGGLDLIMTFNMPDNRRREATAIVGIVGVILGIAGILNFIEVYLGWIAFLGAPIAGVMIADYWIIGKGKAKHWHPIEGFSWAGIIATIISLVIALFIPIGVFNFNGVIISIIVYIIVERFMPSNSRPALQRKFEETINSAEATPAEDAIAEENSSEVK